MLPPNPSFAALPQGQWPAHISQVLVSGQAEPMPMTRSCWFFKPGAPSGPAAAAGPCPAPLSQGQWVPEHDEAAELARIQAARLKVASMMAEARRMGETV